MVFGLVVNEGPYQHQASDTAYNFDRAVIGTGHSIIRVFFYHDGVYNGTRLVVPPQDDRAVTERWSEFAGVVPALFGGDGGRKEGGSSAAGQASPRPRQTQTAAAAELHR